MMVLRMLMVTGMWEDRRWLYDDDDDVGDADDDGGSAIWLELCTDNGDVEVGMRERRVVCWKLYVARQKIELFN